MEKIKSFYESNIGKDILVVIIIILLSISSFFLGRLSTEADKNTLKIEYNGQETNVIPKEIQNLSIPEKINNDEKGSYFASKRGKKYYPVGCSAGKTIKQENRIYFSSANDAEKAGFSASSACVE